MDETNKPIRVYKARSITLSVWENGDEEKSLKSVSYQRSYLDKEEKWQHTTSLHLNDLPVLQALLDEAYKDLVIKEI
jgi:hypothetical protein